MAGTDRDMREACGKGDTEEVERLIRAGVDVNKVDSDYGYTPLYLAAERGHIDIVKLLINNGANISEKSSDGETPLYWVAREGYVDIVKLLLSAGADPYIADNEGETARDVDRTG